MWSARHLSTSTAAAACVLMIALLQVCQCEDVIQSGSCIHPEYYMRPESIDQMKAFKAAVSSMIVAEIGSPQTQASANPCLGGDWLVDMPTAQQYATAVDNMRKQRRKRALIYNFTGRENHKWTTNIMYMYNFSLPELTAIPAALKYVEQQTCIRFNPTATFTSSYMSFVMGSSCTTFYGRSTDTAATQVVLTSDCLNKFGDVINLLASVLGLLNENMRSDQSSAIYINMTNVNPSNMADLRPVPGVVIVSPYDYASVTHVSSKKFAISSAYTILPLDPLLLNVIGQRVEWSFLDTKAINTIYCNGSCSNTLACQHGGYPDPNKCSQCKCPDGFAGTLCDQLMTQDFGLCGLQNLIATTDSNYIVSPGYPNSYSSYSNCTWKITAASPNSRIILTFVDAFGLYQDTSLACFHWVEIRYKGLPETTGPRFCGQQRPISSIVTDLNGEVLVLFRSKFNTTSGNVGFRLLYKLALCEPTWSPTAYNNSNSMYASLVASFFTESSCRNYCAFDRPDCVAVDIDKTVIPYPACWIHTNAADLNNLYRSPGVIQYRILSRDCQATPGPCIPSFVAQPDTNSLYGQKDTSLTTVDQCKSTCAANPQCVAVDWDSTSSPPSCWLHMSPSDLQQSYRTDGVTQYRVLNRCLTTSPTAQGCSPTFSALTDTNALGAQADSTLTTVEQCKNSCAVNPQCVAVDWDSTSSPPRCWVHTNANDLQQLYRANGVTQYQVLTRCSTSAVTTTPGCTPTFSSLENTNSQGAQFDSTLTTLDQCKNSCAVNPQCVAVEWDTTSSPASCWVHTNANDLTNLYQANGVTQYQVRTRCSTFAATTTPAACTPTFSTLENTNSQGAQVDSTLRTLEQCKNSCAVNPQCVAVEWDTTSSPASCWVHTNANDLTNLYQTDGVTQYQVLTRCSTIAATTTPRGCTPSFSSMQNTNSLGAHIDSTLTDLDKCKDYCAVNPQCVAVDWDTTSTPPGCWVHTNASDLLDTFMSDGVTQYRVVTRCSTFAVTTSSAVCTPKFTSQQNTNSLGAQIDSTLTDLDQCKNSCAVNPQCLAVDWDSTSSPPSCWIHTNAADLQDTYTSDGVTQYRVVTRCSTIAVSTTPTPSTVCIPTFTALQGLNSLFGQQDTSLTTLDQCKNSCAINPQCLAVDWDTTSSPPSCWIHTNAADLQDTYTSDGVTQYRVVTRCSTIAVTTATSTSGVCIPSFDSLSDTNSLGGQRSSLTVLDECKNSCTANPQCVAIDWDTTSSPPSCWMHTDQNDLQQTFTTTGVNQYRVRTRCSTITVRATPTTSPSAGSCIPTFTSLQDTNSIGAKIDSSLTTLDQCKNYCAANPQCVAVDWDTTSSPAGCWVHTDANDLGHVYSATGVTQYRVLARCSTFSITPTSTTTTSTTTHTTTTQAVCTPTFTCLPDVHSIGAQIDTSLTTLNQCRNCCAANPQCVAVDWDMTSSPPGCWIHRNSANLLQTYTSTGVTQYRIVTRCSTYTVYTTPASTITPTTTSGSCSPTWLLQFGMSSAGAYQNPSLRTLEDCQGFCAVSPQCVAINWDSNPTPGYGCWVHTNADNLLQLYLTPGVSQYRLVTRCRTVPILASRQTPAAILTTLAPQVQLTSGVTPCAPTWQELRNIHSVGGVLYSWLTTLSQCQEACTLNVLCVAVDWDWNVSPPGCWVHLSRMDLKQLYSTSGITQYQVMTRCNTIAISPTPPLTSPLSTSTSTSTHATSPSTTLTASSTSTTSASAASITASSTSTTQSSTSRASSPSSSTSLSTSTSTSTSTTSPTGCVTTWAEWVGANSAGAYRDGSLSSLEQCKSYCAGNLQCVAVEWDSNPTTQHGCWVHTNPSDLQYHYAASGVTQYRVVDRCTTTVAPTTVAGACQPTWAIYNRTHSVGATLLADSLSADNCLNRCAVDPSCVAVDLRISCTPPQCWQHTNPTNLNTKYASDENVQYVLVTRCHTVAPPVPGVCGGQNAVPGQLCHPCVNSEYPARTCTKQQWVTSFTRNGWITELVTVSVPCTVQSCQQGATLATIQGIKFCVWVGWTDWSSCGSPCQGVQYRNYWTVVGNQYIIYSSDTRNCRC